MITEKNFEEIYPLVRGWIDKGKFTYKGLTYQRGINDYSAAIELAKLVNLRITDLAHWFDEFMCTSCTVSGGKPAKGFSIGKGKALYWYITPMSKSGLYRCIRYFDNGELGGARFIEPTQLVTVHY